MKDANDAALDTYLDEQEQREATDVLGEVAEFVRTLRDAGTRERANFHRFDDLVIAGSRKRRDLEQRAEARGRGMVLTEIADSLQAILGIEE